MPICQNCGERWNWMQTMKRLCNMKCPYCGKKQYESASSRIKTGLFALLSPVAVYPMNAVVEFTIGTAMLVGGIIAISIFALYPFVLTLSNEQEPYD